MKQPKITTDQLRAVMRYKGPRLAFSTEMHLLINGKRVSRRRALATPWDKDFTGAIRLKSPVSDAKTLQPISPKLWMKHRFYRALVLKMARRALYGPS